MCAFIWAMIKVNLQMKVVVTFVFCYVCTIWTRMQLLLFWLWCQELHVSVLPPNIWWRHAMYLSYVLVLLCNSLKRTVLTHLAHKRPSITMLHHMMLQVSSGEANEVTNRALVFMLFIFPLLFEVHPKLMTSQIVLACKF